MKGKINKKLRREILKMVKIDQEMRKRVITEKESWSKLKKIDKENTKRLKEVIKKYAWPTISLVGKKASRGAWLLAQHSDRDLRFQKKVLKMLNEIYKKDKREITPANIAYLTDRILVHENKLQIFGTQFRRKSNGRFEPFPIEDRKNINKRRKRYGLPSLKDNTTQINQKYASYLSDKKFNNSP